MTVKTEIIQVEGRRLALIIFGARAEERVKFFSAPDDELQVGAFAMTRGQEIQPHVHRAIARELNRTTEVLVMQAGRMRVDFYSPEKQYLKSREVGAGDVIVLFDGGHGFTMLDDVRMLEIKQGPYADDLDKDRFTRPCLE